MIFPELVYGLEELCLLRELLLNVFSIEDVLEIHPLSLEGEPLVDNIRDVTEMLLPVFNLGSDLSDILRAHHCLDAHLIILKLGYGIFDITNDEAIL